MKRSPLKRSSPLKRGGGLRSRSSSDTSKARVECDRLLTQCCRMIHADRCMSCGHYGGEPHHLRKRNYRSLQHNVMNIYWLCRRCHEYAEEHPTACLKHVETYYPAILETYYNTPIKRVDYETAKETLLSLISKVQEIGSYKVRAELMLQSEAGLMSIEELHELTNPRK